MFPAKDFSLTMHANETHHQLVICCWRAVSGEKKKEYDGTTQRGRKCECDCLRQPLISFSPGLAGRYKQRQMKARQSRLNRYSSTCLAHRQWPVTKLKIQMFFFIYRHMKKARESTTALALDFLHPICRGFNQSRGDRRFSLCV